MTATKKTKTQGKSKALIALEIALLAVCLCVLVLRCTYTEGPPTHSSTLPINLSDVAYSLNVSAVLLMALLLYVAWRAVAGRLQWRPAGIEIPLLLFCLAGLIAGFAASDKRAAITYLSVLLAPMLMAMLLVQLLDSPAKIKIVLAVVAALGLVNVYQGADQFFSSNQMTIQQYEEDPQTILEPLGIEKGTIQHFLFEHRLYSRGVRGYLTTRNSAGSFFLLALFAALALLPAGVKWSELQRNQRAMLIALIAVIVLVLFGLALTKSKGAIIGLLFASLALGLYYSRGRWLAAHKKVILAACVLLTVAAAATIMWYGLTHNRLPGGNPMLVRWQYWHATGRMIADHPFAGVGPGNFATFYTHYKPPAALESVADPHNFVLSLLAQFGPLGLLAFVAAIALPLYRITQPRGPAITPPASSGRESKALVPLLLGAACATLLIVRPLLMPANITGAAPAVLLYVTFAFYIAPAAVFLIGFFMAAGSFRSQHKNAGKAAGPDQPAADRAVPILFCAVLAVAVHNLIDFAVFEPPVFTTLWAIIACLIAAHHNRRNTRPVALRPAPAVRIPLVLLCIAVAWAYFQYAFLPAADATDKMARARQAVFAGNFDIAHSLLQAAAQDDPLNPDPPATNARISLQNYEWSQSQDRDLLLRAERSLQTAIDRDPASYKNYERLTETYCRLAEIPTDREPSDWLEKAMDSARKAVERYPGCARLHLDLAQVAEQLGRIEPARRHYRRTVEIEDAYRAQFRRMYPEKKQVISRLGEDQYKFAADRLRQLPAP